MIYPLKTSEYLIMTGFFPDANEKTIKELGERSGYSYERVYNTLKSLEDKGIVTGRRVGKTLSYEIDLGNDATELAFVHFSMVRRAWFDKKYPKASKAMHEFLDRADADCVIVFGHYAKGNVKEGSYLNILCVSRSEDIEEIALSLKHRYFLEINTISIELEEFKNIKAEIPEFWSDLIEFGIILKGYELCYNYIYRTRK